MSAPKPLFQVRYWGVRASIPTPGPDTVLYGGNTACIEVRCDDQILVIDMGTGARELGRQLRGEFEPPLDVSILFSHLHMDHIQGFPFFDPIYDATTRAHIYSPRPEDATARQFLAWHMAFPWFPVDLDKLESDLEFVDVPPGEAFDVGPVRVSTCPIPHPGGAMAIRIDHRGHSFVHASDLEVGEGGPPEPLVELARGADILSFDSTYLPGVEYEQHRGWGHSTWRDGVAVADAAGVGTFVAFHHDPSHDDDLMDDLAASLHAARPGSHVAREGMTFHLLDDPLRMELRPARARRR